MKTRLIRMLLPLLCGIMGHTAWAQGTIQYVNPPDIWFVGTGDRTSLPLDLDGNGTDDYMLHTRYGSEFMLVGFGENASLAVPAPPPNLGSRIVPLAEGSALPAIPSVPLQWVTSYISVVDPISGPFYIAPLFHARSTIGTVGFWNNIEAYAGLQFEIDGQMHFGWLRLETDSFRTGGTLKDWAYNSAPGQPILAGQVPEPGTVALLVAGCGFLWWRARRVQRQPDLVSVRAGRGQPHERSDDQPQPPGQRRADRDHQSFDQPADD